MSVLFSVADSVATVTLNRPEAMNAIDAATMQEMVALWDTLRRDDAIRVIILTGAGNRAFCTGMDLKNTMPPDASYAARQAVAPPPSPPPDPAHRRHRPPAAAHRFGAARAAGWSARTPAVLRC